MTHPINYVWCCSICWNTVSTGLESDLPKDWKRIKTNKNQVLIICAKHIPKKSKDGGTNNEFTKNKNNKR